jgi:coenzyme PQQ precursor peptide PqqA
MKTTKEKRTWSKPTVQEEQAGMEVTSYASADLWRRSDNAPKKAG